MVAGRTAVGYKQLAKGIVKRRQTKILGLFIDGTGLDRATRRLHRKVDMAKLVRGVSSGLTPTVARYYTLIPYEDDSRQIAFLDAVAKAGLDVVVKRLPPKGVERQVSVDVEMAADIAAFAFGHTRFGELKRYRPSTDSANEGSAVPGAIPFRGKKAESSQRQFPAAEEKSVENQVMPGKNDNAQFTDRIVTVVCPSPDLAYPIAMVTEIGVDTVTVDFGKFKTRDVLKSAAKWIDLSDSETIWRDD
ncbi:MAG: NYN domain-containing protein [Candidatus Dadabacteria bacterium]|nr:MAG: NYN domain-containing protein [Candidatus Dadabacteria bacterium]